MSQRWEKKGPNERKGSPKREEGRRMQLERRKVNVKQISLQVWQKSSWTNMKEIRLENTVVWKAQTGGRKSPNWGKEEKQFHSRTQCTCARLVNEKVRVHVLSRPILCGVVHFQWKFLPQSAMEEKFPGYRPFVLPTHFHKWVGEPDYLFCYLHKKWSYCTIMYILNFPSKS